MPRESKKAKRERAIEEHMNGITRRRNARSNETYRFCSTGWPSTNKERPAPPVFVAPVGASKSARSPEAP